MRNLQLPRGAYSIHLGPHQGFRQFSLLAENTLNSICFENGESVLQTLKDERVFAFHASISTGLLRRSHFGPHSG